MPIVLQYRSVISTYKVSTPPHKKIVFPDLKNTNGLEQEIVVIGKYLAQKTCSYCHSLFCNAKCKHLKIKYEKQLHRLQAKFIATVLEKLPFLYCGSADVEEFHWKKLAYELYKDFSLIPDVVRYQLGPNYFISYGTILNQLKREFFILFNDNIKNGMFSYPGENTSCRFSKTFLDSFESQPLQLREKTLSDDYEYFTPAEIRQQILSGDRNTQDFDTCSYNKEEKCLKEWYHRWGFVYETNRDVLYTLHLEILNYEQELKFLDNLLKLNLEYSDFPSGLSITQQILKKKDIINTQYLPRLYISKAEKLEAISKVKRKSEAYHRLVDY